MVIDCHVHICAASPGHGGCPTAAEEPPVPLHALAARHRALRGRDDRAGSRGASSSRRSTQTERLDAAVVLAFDAVHGDDGGSDDANTHLYVTNDYVIELAKRHPKMLFGASRPPVPQGRRRRSSSAASRPGRCCSSGCRSRRTSTPPTSAAIPFYEALPTTSSPLLSHTGGEKSLPEPRHARRRPALLEPAARSAA